MAHTVRRETHPADQPLPDIPSLPSMARDPAVGVRSPAASPIDDADGLMPASAAKTRLCVLCGEPLRAGQRLLRVHGSTIHSRCTSTRG
jgi:hypothetical protein